MENNILKLEKKVYLGENSAYEDLIELHKEDINLLCMAANRIREKFMKNDVDLCSIINAKCGKCSEDCKYCVQSAHYHTEIEKYNYLDDNKILDLALENEACGVNRFSLVTSGRALSGEEFEKCLESFKKLKTSTNLKLCASLGILNMDQLTRLKEVGVSRYHHNIETSKEYFSKICTTHSFEDRINTINNAKAAGLRVCSGGIIGMGESFEDRINMALELKSLNIDSIPINILTPIKGTPFESIQRLSEEEILRTIAIFRFINPKAYIRLAGGRGFLSNYGEKAFQSGANAAISGNYLTTSGNKIVDDINMINNLGLEVAYND